jgi:hypothetical protein
MTHLQFLKNNGIEVLLANNRRCIDPMARFQDENKALWREDIGDG